MRHSDVQHLRFNEIERCKARVCAYVRALEEELRLRREHATQFIDIREYQIITTVNEVVSMDGVYARI